ncbi:MAG TPA: hypothetical protein DDY82_05405, partial [Clostridiales bacterium]|nr:hypothetical protein [Clostridiales bacterium]
MKKISFILIFILCFAVISPLTACSKEEKLVLNVYNCEEYIAEGEDFDMVTEFENYYYKKYNKKVTVNYSTYGTNENMYNELKLTKNKKNNTYSYDLVCPSDYMLLKMIKEDMLEEFDLNEDGSYKYIPEYENNVSDYIKNLFQQNDWYRYGVCYMWGTMGYVYNPEKVSHEDMKSWEGILNPAYKFKSTIKDSARDSYILAQGIAFKDKLNALDKTSADYNQKLSRIFNDTSKEALKKSEDVLRKVKDSVYGFEVDSGKADMASGKIWINFAWSGDAVYTLDEAETYGTELYYSVPEEGSNVWFDGWVMPKGANKALAQEFLNFLNTPENVIENMNYIGYTSAIAGDVLFDNTKDWYGLYVLVETSDGDIELNGKTYSEEYFGDLDEATLNSFKNADGTYNLNIPEYNDDDEVISFSEETIEVYPYDVSYFFSNISEENKTEGKAVIYTDTIDRQLYTQYPDGETIERCIIMDYFTKEQNNDLNNMWSSVKIGYMSPVT